MKKLLLGDEAIALGAIHAGLSGVYAYPGTPSTEKGNTGFFDTARITFNCQPFMYEAVDSVYEYTQTDTILNLGTEEAYPKIVVEGSGDVSFSVAGKIVTLNGMTSGVPITLDCENGYVWAESGSFTMVGDFPTIPIGTSNINIGNATKLTITPYWRWI